MATKIEPASSSGEVCAIVISPKGVNSPLTERGDHLGVAAVVAAGLGEAAAAAAKEAGEVGGVHSCSR